MEEWISLNEFARRQKLGHATILKLIANHEVDYIKTGTRYKIKVGGNSVSREMYEQERERRIQAETKLQMLKDFIDNLMEQKVKGDDLWD